MKKYILLIIILIAFVSCKTETQIIDGNTSLKNLSTTFFTAGNTSVIQFKEKQLTYNNTFERLPNTKFSKFYLKEHPKMYMPYFNLTVNLATDGKITLEGTPNDQTHIIKDIKEFIDFASRGKSAMLHLNFEENITVAQFHSFLQLIKPIETTKIKINNKLFIYNTKNLPDCDCSL